jgi:hypothetical protein
MKIYTKLKDIIHPKKIFDHIKNDWFLVLVISVFLAFYLYAMVTFGDSFSDFFFKKNTPQKEGQKKFLELLSIGLILLGGLWTTLGVHLTADDKKKLNEMAASKQLDPVEIVRLFKAASNFATSGAMLILLGSVGLIGALLMHTS